MAPCETQKVLTVRFIAEFDGVDMCNRVHNMFGREHRIVQFVKTAIEPVGVFVSRQLFLQIKETGEWSVSALSELMAAYEGP
jgi:hypothetical protein